MNDNIITTFETVITFYDPSDCLPDLEFDYGEQSKVLLIYGKSYGVLQISLGYLQHIQKYEWINYEGQFIQDVKRWAYLPELPEL